MHYSQMKFTQFWYFDGKYYKAVGNEKRVKITREEFVQSTHNLPYHDSRMTGIRMYTKTERVAS